MELFKGDLQDWKCAILALIATDIISNFIFNFLLPFGDCQNFISLQNSVSCYMQSYNNPFAWFSFIFPKPEPFLGSGLIGIISIFMFMVIAFVVFLGIYVFLIYMTYKRSNSSKK